jgi:hypothetical protein
MARFAGSFAEERQALYDVAGEYNEAEAMGRGWLFSVVSCGSAISGKREAVDSNIRMCRYYLLVVEDSWDAPPASFRHDYELALKCKADPSLPLQDIAVLFKQGPVEPESDGAFAAFRRIVERAGGVRQIDFADFNEFKAHVGGLFSEWLRATAV